MAQTGYTPISLYYSSTASATPTAGNLVAGELAINTADGKLFYKDSAGVVQVIGTKGGVGTSSTTQVLYNSSGLVVGSANLTFNGTTLTVVNDASISGLTVGKGGGSVSTNTVVGNGALASNSTGNYNSAFGQYALNANTSDGNNAFGFYSQNATTSGTYNVSFGTSSMYANTTGSYNVALGGLSLRNNTTASNNTAVGYQAGYSNTTGVESAILGYQAGYSNTTSGRNTFIGAYAGYNSTGTQNCFVGAALSGGASGLAMTTGSKNTILGSFTGNQGGLDIRTASNYIVLSDGDGNPRGVFDGSGNFMVGQTAIVSAEKFSIKTSGSGQFAYWVSNSTSSNPTMFRMSTGVAGGAIGSGNFIYCEDGGSAKFYVVGGGSIYSTNTSISAISDQRLKENVRDLETGLAEVMALKPRRFDWMAGEGTDQKDVAGFIAQEVETVLPDLVGEWKHSPEEETIYKSLQTGNMIPTLVKAIQELKAEVDSLKQQLGK